jgi:hypothetical protein
MVGRWLSRPDEHDDGQPWPRSGVDSPMSNTTEGIFGQPQERRLDFVATRGQPAGPDRVGNDGVKVRRSGEVPQTGPHLRSVGSS